MSFLIKFVICSILLQTVQVNGHGGDMIKRTLRGTYYWQLMLDIDNLNNVGTFTREIQVTVSTYTSHKSFKEYILNEESSSDYNTLAGTYFILYSAEVKSDVSTEIRAGYQNVIQSQTEVTTTITKTDKYNVGPKSRLTLYRLVFNGPGVQYQTDTISSTPHHLDDVEIDVTVKPVLFLEYIQVVYTDDAASSPNDAIFVANEPDGNINKGFGGKYTWLVPVWTTQTDKAATGIEICIQYKSNAAFDDLEKGTGGSYFRYIKILRRYANNNERISEIALWRASKGDDTTPKGYQHRSHDINDKRGGGWLFLVWNTMKI